MKANEKLLMNRIANEILNLQVKILEANELIHEIQGTLLKIEETSFDLLNTSTEMKELSKQLTKL
jgi:hypothetical protein